MATVSLTVVPGKAMKDGKNKVRIAVAHRSQTRYIVTDVVLDSPREWKNGKVVRRDDAGYLNVKLLTKMREVQDAIDGIFYAEGLSCSELVDAVTSARKKKMHTLQTAFDEMMEVSTAMESSKRAFVSWFRAITAVIPASTPVAQLSPVMVQRFVQKRSKELSQATLKSQVGFIGQIVNYCQRNEYTNFRISPTSGCVKSAVVVRQNWLTPDEVRRFRDMDIRAKGLAAFRDFFMLSYYLGGINAVDLLKIDFNECSDRIRYVRQKTERSANICVEFDIPDEAKAIIAKMKQPDGHLKIGDYSPATCSHISDKCRKKRDDMGLPHLTFYSARKSFAQHAFSLGENESVIDYLLGHAPGGGRRTTLFSYVKVTPEMATKTVRKVCDFIASTENF